MEKCLYCYKPLSGKTDFHSSCSRKIFGSPVPPELPYAENELEELALTLNGKKKKIRKGDFTQAFNVAGLDKRQQENIISKMMACKEDWLTMIQKSFLSDEFKEKYAELLVDRISVFEG